MDTPALKPKLSYNAKLYRVRLSFTKAMADASEQPPLELIEHGAKRLEALKQTGEIKYLRTYGDRLTAIWSKVREGPKFADQDFMFTVSVAAGAPDLPGVEVHPATSADHLFLLTLPSNPDIVKPWRLEWLKIVISQKARDLNIAGYSCQAQIYGALIAAQHGREVTKLPIRQTATADTKPDDPKHPYKLLFNRLRQEITLHAYEMTYFLNPENVQKLIHEIKEAAEKASTLESKIRSLDEEVIANLKAALAGPEVLGLDLPFVQLAAASASPKVTYKKKPVTSQTKRGIYPTSPDYGWQIEWDDANMIAKFAFFDPRVYKEAKVPLDQHWLSDMLRAAGIDENMMVQDLTEFDQKVRGRLSLKGVVVARGIPGQAGSGPYLHLNFKDGDQSGNDSLTIDMRNSQQRKIVQKDQLVAEVRYKVSPIHGKNIFGHMSSPPRGEGLQVGPGDGILQSGDQFYARFAGLPEILDGPPITVRLSKALVHNGDVNLASGNIIFAGNVEVKGNVETGALLRVGGDLKVDGSVNGGTIICGGSVLITGGITSKGETHIVAKGNIQANFAQNSRLRSGGEINVSRGLIGSEIVAQGNVNVTNNDGMILGGHVLCGGSVNSPKVGRSDGASTTIEAGAYPKPVLRERQLKKRMEFVQRVIAEDRKGLALLDKKSASQLTLHHREQQKNLRARIAQAERMIPKLKKIMDASSASNGAKFNAAAKIIVSGKLANNCVLWIGGVQLHITDEKSNVTLSQDDANGGGKAAS